MEKQAAENLISNTFNRPFDESSFSNFIRNLLNDIDESKAFPYLYGNYIRHSFTDHVKQYRRIGIYTDPNGERIEVLIVHLKRKAALEHARTRQRNFIAWYLNGGRGGILRDAALVAFASPDLDDWRFSYVRMEYKEEVTESGKVKVKEELTPAKRYSFLVGKNEPNHTAQQQLLPLLKNDSRNPTLSELEDAFSVEAVTKQFYLDYEGLFEKLKKELDHILEKDSKIKQEFETRSIDTANFAKKLLGQIVFLYFLQKKGWLGVPKDERWGQGDKRFLGTLLKRCIAENKNFFNDYLEYLFYEALATTEGRATIDLSYYPKFYCKIPFLNGGLFEPINGYSWQETDIRLDNNLFAEIFDTFDRYNFTVREDEPLEKEVAVDPEMLGKVFENLLPENLRKGQGTHYTPREIVHYMCQESLINYLDTAVNTGGISLLQDKPTQGKLFGDPEPEQLRLKGTGYKTVIPKKHIEDFIRKGEFAVEHDTAKEEEIDGTKSYKYQVDESIRKNARLLDEKLETIKICDLAIGSGAYPVGMMHEIVKARNVLETYLKTGKAAYDFKRHCIQESIYGVDIDPGAIEIAKLRLWLSLVVDEENYLDIKPLPNLDYKIMQGNSLIEDFHGVSLNLEKSDELLFSENEELDPLIEYLHRKQSEFFNEIHHSDKNRLKEEVEDAIIKVFHYELKRRQGQYDKALDRINKLANAFPKEEDRKKCYDAEKAKLDKRYKLDFEAVENELREMTHGNKIRNFFPWKLYFANVFKNNNGFDVMIANPPYVRADLPNSGHADFRKKLEESNEYKTLYEKWDLFIPFIEKALTLLSKKGNLRFITSNALCTSKYAHKLLDLIQKEYAMNSIDYFENMEVFEGVGVIPVVIGISKDKSTVENVSKIIRQEVFENIRQEKRISLTEFNKLGRNAFRKNYQEVSLDVETEKLGDICYISYGLRPNSDERYWKGEFTKNDLIRDTRDDIYCRRYIEGKNIDRYAVKKIQFLEWNTDRVPHKLVRKTFSELYDRPKILRGILTGAIYDDSKLVCNHSIMVFVRFINLAGVYNKSIKNSISKFNSLPRRELEEKSKDYDLKYLLAIMNSRFAYHYLNNHRRHRLENYFYPDDLRKLPIPKIALDDHEPFISLVDQILSLKKSDPQTDTSALEAEINRMVYDLYGLTAEEIAIVEESIKR